MKTTMTKALIGALGAGIMTLSIAATTWSMSPADDHHRDPAHLLEKMSKRLELTSEQEKTVEGLLTGSFSAGNEDKQRLQALHDELRAQRSGFDAGQAQQAADEIGAITSRMVYRMASTHAEIYQVLSDEQKAQLDTFMEKRQGKRHKRRHMMQDFNG